MLNFELTFEVVCELIRFRNNDNQPRFSHLTPFD